MTRLTAESAAALQCGVLRRSVAADQSGPRTIAIVWFTGCSRIWKNGLGYRPIQNAMMRSGTKVATSRGVRSCSFSFFGFVTVPKKTRW